MWSAKKKLSSVRLEFCARKSDDHKIKLLCCASFEFYTWMQHGRVTTDACEASKKHHDDAGFHVSELA